MAKVFISYSSKQFREASQVCEYLERHGVLCWMAPRNIDPGSNYASQIVQAIRDSSALVLLASNHTNVSGHVSNEVSLAFDCKKTIIPFKIENVQFSDEYLYYLGRKHWIDAFIDFPTALESLLHTLNTIIPNKQLPANEIGKTQNAVLRKLFVKGTYPQIANLTYYYNIWTGYYNGTNINARVARDINTIQTSYTFFEYYLRYPDHFSPTEILAWTKNQDKLNTEIGFKLWEQLILNNVSYRPFWNR